MKKFLSVASAGLLSKGVQAQPVSAKDDDVAKAIAGIVAIGIIGAAIADHQHKSGHDVYSAHPRVHPDENAVGACMHHGKRLVEKAGGNYFQLDNVDRVDVQGADTVVVFEATGFYDFGAKSSVVRCTVRNSQVVAFDYS